MITARIGNASIIAVVTLAGVIGVAPETGAADPAMNVAPAVVGAAESAPVPPPAITMTGVDAEQPRAKFDAFRAALDGYNVAVRNRIQKSDAESVARFQAASRQVTRAGRAFLESIRNATDEADRSRASKDIDEFDGAGKRLVIAADDQRELLVDYSNRVRAMTARTRDAIDEAWMLFGRVFARDSLIALKAELAELRRRSERLDAARKRTRWRIGRSCGGRTGYRGNARGRPIRTNEIARPRVVRKDARRSRFACRHTDEAAEVGCASKRHGDPFRRPGISTEAPHRTRIPIRSHRTPIAGAPGTTARLGAGTRVDRYRVRRRNRDAAGTATAA